MAKQTNHKPTIDDAFANLAVKLSEDPIKRFETIDVQTFNLIGEIALGFSKKETFTPNELAEMFHAHLEKTFRNKVCDERGSRENMIGCLEMSLKITTFKGVESTVRPGYISLGTVLVKRVILDSGSVAFSFVEHPNPKEIYRC